MVKISIAVSSVLFAALAASQSLTDALKATPELAGLNTALALFPELAATVAGLKGVTILAPNNQAFQKLQNMAGEVAKLPPGLVQSILTYHVLNGTFESPALTGEGGAIAPTLLTATEYANLNGDLNVVFASQYGSFGIGEEGPLQVYSGVGNAANVVKADVKYDGGIVHIIDTVLNIPKNCTATAADAKLTSLVAAINKAELATVVDTTPEFTCFAPTNAAFEKAGVNLDEMSKEEIAEVLKYHAVIGTVGYSSVLEDGQEIETAQGGTIKVTVKDGKVYVNDIAVIQANVITSNGVVHVLDGVLTPEAAQGPKPNATTPAGGNQTPPPADSSATKLGAGLLSAAAAVFALVSLF